MSDDDYGFTYSDEEDVDEDEVDVENAYYNAKGADAWRERLREARGLTDAREEQVCWRAERTRRRWRGSRR